MNKITIDRAVVEQALEALELAYDYTGQDTESGRELCREARVAAKALRAALAQQAEPVQEPVAIVGTQEDVWKGHGGQWAPPGPPIKMVHMLRELPVGALLYTTPPQRKPLSGEELPAFRDGDHAFLAGVRFAEAAHGIEEKK